MNEPFDPNLDKVKRWVSKWFGTRATIRAKHVGPYVLVVVRAPHLTPAQREGARRVAESRLGGSVRTFVECLDDELEDDEAFKAADATVRLRGA